MRKSGGLTRSSSNRANAARTAEGLRTHAVLVRPAARGQREGETSSAASRRTTEGGANGVDPLVAAFEEFWAIKPNRDGSQPKGKGFASYVRAVEGWSGFAGRY